MAVTVGEYLDYLRMCSYPSLFSEKEYERLERIEKQYGTLETEETILEVCLSDETTGCDYSIRRDVDSRHVKEYWYELDGDACDREEITPCYFVDASCVRPDGDNSAFYEEALVKLAGRERADRLLPMLQTCVSGLKGKCRGLFQLGSMSGRGEWDRLRLFTEDMTAEAAVQYLRELGWAGNAEALLRFLSVWEPYSDGKSFILDFDVRENGISERIGINFGTRSKKVKDVEAFLDALERADLCTAEKKRDVLRFVMRFPAHTPFIQDDISHFKIPFQGERPLRAKAYLRQGSVSYGADYRAYDSPVLMNLELTTRCPLHCPQCYCDLSEGRDMSLDTALFWLKEAAENRVRTVNLSGGETLLYPWLEKLVQTCREYGMEANIAISGYGASRERLETLISCGVSDICVSLNGSTEEINGMSRDGYGLAVEALRMLQEIRYQRTCINWVMHAGNTEDFPDVVRLAERYGAAAVAVMALKPDAAHRRSDMPEAGQLRWLARWIKGYQGPVRIEAEECFSQLRALLGERYLLNLNRGIARGCGAGRDGISVSVDGRLTPCRHLDIREAFGTIREYWETSAVLKQLREAEDAAEEPCRGCSYRRYCLPCMAVSWKMRGRIGMGEKECGLWKRDEEGGV